MRHKDFRPDWSERAPAPGTFRSIAKYGDPHHFKHPSDAWVKMMKQEFHMSENDFYHKQNEGNAPVVLNLPPALKPEQIEALAAIVGKENVALDDYARVKYSSAKTSEEILEL